MFRIRDATIISDRKRYLDIPFSKISKYTRHEEYYDEYTYIYP